jgi:hypothetical protein
LTRDCAYRRLSFDCVDTVGVDHLASQASIKASVSAANPRQIQLVWASDFRGTDGSGLQWLCAWRVPALPPAGPAQAVSSARHAAATKTRLGDRSHPALQ